MAPRTFFRQLQDWHLDTRHHSLEASEELINRVKFLFYEYGYSDQSLLRDLQQEGFSVHPFLIRKIRFQEGLKRRAKTKEEQLVGLQRALEFFRQDLQKTSMILGLGRGLLWNYVRQQGKVLISQHRLYSAYAAIFPQEVAGRRDAKLRYRGNFKVPGPNFLWSLDGYEKLKKFGFQIYACIDAYSRCIIWFFVGRSATTSMSTLKQFLQTVKQLRMRPFFTRSDHGTETPLWAAAQATLAKLGPKKLKFIDIDGIEHFYTQGDRLSSCHLYGPSTRNIRIESWWRQLRHGVTDRWIAFFNELAGYAVFREESQADQIAIYAIYGGIIRDELARFVSLWNGHKIRNQKNRPHVNHGIPQDLYHTQAVENWGVSLSEDDEAQDWKLLNEMLDPLLPLDMESLLPEFTMSWCQQQLEEIGFDSRIDLQDDPERPFVNEFIKLRDRIKAYEAAGLQPELALTPIYKGGAKEYERLLQRNYTADAGLSGDAIPRDMQMEIEIADRENPEL
uniref:Integrase core domain-containing protein n=1 Tax=Bionectria ochroleuca TaxID=29856 RepID=A0A8H7N332_BIOOC